MTILGRLLAAAILFVVAARAASMIAQAAFDFPSRTAVYFTEPQMVHLSRQVQVGGSVCPEWRESPHVVNVFTPGYFLLVGGIGKAADASLEGVQRIGRGATIAFGVFGAVLMALAVRGFGKAAMAAAGGMTIASGMMIGFGWMCRPDVTADVLGFAGFLAATSSAPVWIAVLSLGAAMFCKQTAALYVAAAVTALVWGGSPRRAYVIAAGSAAAVGTMLGILFLTGERRAFADLLLESSSPWRWDHWKTVNFKFFSRAGDGLLLSLTGVAFWLSALRRGDERQRADSIRWLSLLAVAAAVGVVGSAKLGSDVNYFLPLRFVAVAALAVLTARLMETTVRFSSLAAGLAVMLSLLYWFTPILASLQRQVGSPDFAARRASWEREIDGVLLMSRSKKVLTNCDDAALRIGNPFVDSFVFKMMVDDGRLKPTAIKEGIERGEYDWIITTADVDDANYVASSHGIPKELADVILKRYEKAFRQALIYYRPRKE
jgi:hypothetical protein